MKNKYIFKTCQSLQWLDLSYWYPLHIASRRLTLQTWRTRPDRNTGNTSSLQGTQTEAAGRPKNSATIVCVKVKMLVYYNKSYNKMVFLPYILCTLYIYINTHIV